MLISAFSVIKSFWMKVGHLEQFLQAPSEYHADVENWPRCDVLICFFSTDFPLPKAVSYVNLRQPICINSIATQELLLDRRLVGQVLDTLQVPCPHRLVASRDGGPKVSAQVRRIMFDSLGIQFPENVPPAQVEVTEDGEAILVNGQIMRKPYVEKPVSGEDHNVYIYFKGGGGRKLFRKARHPPILSRYCGVTRVLDR
jgi:inositol hexakisphosphate/diphosphoinositol-pentakisphosphate kinase